MSTREAWEAEARTSPQPDNRWLRFSLFLHLRAVRPASAAHPGGSD